MTYIRNMSERGMFAWSIKKFIRANNDWAVDDQTYHAAYLNGYAKPNYPMPAIRTKTIIEPDYVAIHGTHQVHFVTFHKG